MNIAMNIVTRLEHYETERDRARDVEAAPESADDAGVSRRQRWSILASAVATGAIAGVAAAVIAVAVQGYLNPPLDRRLDPLAAKVAVIAQTVDRTSTTLAAAQTDIAQSIDFADSVGKHLDKQDAAIAALGKRLDQYIKEQPTLGLGSPIFGVAVAQLRTAALSGLPFETELVNLYGLAQGDARITAPLQALVGLSRHGVPTIAGLRQQLTAATQPAGGDGYLSSGLAMVSGWVNYVSATDQVGPAIAGADAALSRNDVAGAIAAISRLDKVAKSAFAAWLEAAQKRAAADKAIGQLNELVVATTSQRMKQLSGQ
jgi:hypothetical protein